MFYILGTVVLVLLVVIGIALYFERKYYSDAAAIVVVLAIIALFITGIPITISTFNWFAAEQKAKLINREFSTQYTTDEIFWAEDVINEIRELKRNRIELNGNLMGHGKNPDGPQFIYENGK